MQLLTTFFLEIIRVNRYVEKVSSSWVIQRLQVIGWIEGIIGNKKEPPSVARMLL